MTPIIFCERTGDWATSWRRIATNRSLAAIAETRSPAECRETLDEQARSGTAVGFLLVELHAANVDEVLDLLWRVALRFPAVATAVVAERQMQPYVELVRELARLDLVTSPRRLAPLVRLAARHLARQTLPESNDRERILATLPWGS